MNSFLEVTMLKEVGASGQISLGKKYAGQLFEMQIAVDGAVTLTPVKVVPVAQAPVAAEELAAYKVSTTTQEWASVHADEIAQYNEWVTQREPYAQRVRRWREQGQSLPSEEGKS
ncbi:MAG: hypothetical protein K9K35_12735 [Rhodoferax sp.]|nr:hypothetical protein [Rhodoferax sp.]